MPTSLVRVVAGKNAAKQGWTRTADLAYSTAEAAADQEQQAQPAATPREQQEALARAEPEEEAARVPKIYEDTKETLRQACGETFDQGGTLRYILAQDPTDGPRLDAYTEALEEQINCPVMLANSRRRLSSRASRRWA
jgi:hypothetical protein